MFLDKSAEPWLYFLAGALLPSIAYYFTLRTPPPPLAEEDDEIQDDEIQDDDDDDSDAPAVQNGPSSSWGRAHGPYKMVFCVNTSLSMGKGKIAAQCGHAALGCYKRAMKQCPQAVQEWEWSGCAKIALKCPTEEDMEEIAAKAIAKDIPLYLVEDAGRTQIAAGSRTVLGLFGPTSVFEGVSDHLKLM